MSGTATAAADEVGRALQSYADRGVFRGGHTNEYMVENFGDPEE